MTPEILKTLVGSLDENPSPHEILSAYIGGVMSARGQGWFEWLADQDWQRECPNCDPYHRDTDKDGRRFFAVVWEHGEILIYEDGTCVAESILPPLPEVLPSAERFYPRLVSTTWEVPKSDVTRPMLRTQIADLLSRMPGAADLQSRGECVELKIEGVKPSEREGYVLVTMSVWTIYPRAGDACS